MRPKKSYFTRVQRLTCALALLFLMMITNAMWFQDPSAPPTAGAGEGAEPGEDPDEADTTEDGVRPQSFMMKESNNGPLSMRDITKATGCPKTKTMIFSKFWTLPLTNGGLF